MSVPHPPRRIAGRLPKALTTVLVGLLGVATVAGVTDLLAAGGAAATGGPLLPPPVAALEQSAVTSTAETRPALRPRPPRRPVRLAVASVSVDDGTTYGVGMPVVVTFDREVPEHSRPRVQAAAAVVADREIGPAVWTWMTPTLMAYRPRQFWPAGTRVTLDLALDDLVVGNAAPRRALVGADDVHVTFEIGRAQVTTVDLASQTARVVRDGETVRWVPVSTGGPGFETRQGTKIVLGKEPGKVFTGDAFDEDYELVARSALRITATGEYLHSAPWATGRLGRYAGSHGCTNMSDTDGAWFMETALVGDPVLYSGDSDAPLMEPLNGLGGVWNVPWPQWRADSAGVPLQPEGRAVLA